MATSILHVPVDASLYESVFAAKRRRKLVWQEVVAEALAMWLRSQGTRADRGAG